MEKFGVVFMFIQCFSSKILTREIVKTFQTPLMFYEQPSCFGFFLKKINFTSNLLFNRHAKMFEEKT
jgi:hypothetical protein